MQNLLKILPQLVGGLYLIGNLILLYIFLTPKRSRLFQSAALIITSVTVIYLLYPNIGLYTKRGLFVDYLLGSLYLIPCILIFGETLQAKIFVFFMNFSLTQFIFLIFMHLDRFLEPAIPRLYVIIGLMLELAALPLIKMYLREPVRNIIGIINRKHSIFTIYPILSFALLAYYALLGNFILSTFVSLVLSALLIFFTYYLISVSITAAKRQQELEVISNSDSLTGIFNRRHMERKIKEEFRRYHKTGMEFALIIADIDFFKTINDKYGHDCGDRLLIEIVKDLSKTVRSHDTFARWGGEEFLFLLPATNREHAAKLAERIRISISGHKYSFAEDPISITLTLGVTVVRPEDTPAAMIKRADTALYHGKQKSRNCVIVFDEMENHVRDK